MSLHTGVINIQMSEADLGGVILAGPPVPLYEWATIRPVTTVNGTPSGKSKSGDASLLIIGRDTAK